MITSNELRLGNIYDRKHGKGRTWTMITEEILGKIFSNSKEYALDDFEPIKITHKLLSEIGYRNFLIDAEYGASFDYHEKEDYFVLLDCDGGIVGSKKHFLHELQNFYYAVSGQELKINFLSGS